MQIGNLALLTHFDASFNSLRKIPAEIGAHVELHWPFILCHNMALSLPPSSPAGLSNACWTGLLTNLTHLDIAKNLISQLPPSIGYLENLQHFGLEHNRIQRLPLEMRSLRSASLTFRGGVHLSLSLAYCSEIAHPSCAATLHTNPASLSPIPSPGNWSISHSTRTT